MQQLQINKNRELTLLLKLATFSILFGRAWEHFMYDPPYHTFFWDYNYTGWFIEGVLNINWNTFLTTPDYDNNLHLIQLAIGFVFLCTSISVWFYSGQEKGINILLLTSTILMFFLGLITMKDHEQQFGQLLEMSIQITTPAILYSFLKNELSLDRLIQATKIIVSLTFIGHGLYAIGFYYQPPDFVKMIRSTTSMSYENALISLKLIGALDILAGILLFVPNKRILKICLIHIILWGFITALGRLAGNINYNHFWFTFKQLWHLSMFRLSHGIIPLFLYYCLKRELFKTPKPFTNITNYLIPFKFYKR